MYLFDSICYIQLTPEMGMDKFEMKESKIGDAVENGDGWSECQNSKNMLFSNRLK